MRNVLKGMTATFLAIIISFGTLFPVLGAGQPSSYSKSANSGVRGVVCTTLSGTGAASYYTGSYTYDALSELSSGSLLTTLRNLMKSTHKKQTSYSECRDLATKTDCENANGSSIIMIYTSYEGRYGEYDSGNGWNREHVWPKSLGGFETSGAGADLHHIRPSENKTNTDRDNRLYGNVSGGSVSKGNLSGTVGGYYNTNYYEPVDSAKGDVARICLYVYVRYGGDLSKCSKITNVFQNVDTLLEWCELDPVDTWEMGRNEVVSAIQGNRNVFIDYPEFAWMLFGREVPDGMTTPSGESANGGNNDTPVTPDTPSTPVVPDTPVTPEDPDTPSTPCTHDTKIKKDAKAATCTELGYSGDTVCEKCGELFVMGTPLPALGHSFGEAEIVTPATEEKRGVSRKVCESCGEETLDFIPRLEADNTAVIVTVIIAASAVTVSAVAITVIKVRKKARIKKYLAEKAKKEKR